MRICAFCRYYENGCSGWECPFEDDDDGYYDDDGDDEDWEYEDEYLGYERTGERGNND
jgi:hypothetical protein